MTLDTLRTALGSALLAAGFALAPAADAQITLDGTITESDWTVLGTSAGGPAPGFGAGQEINALAMHREGSDLYLGIAGNVQAGNRILVFLDTRAGGFASGDFGRTGAPAGIANFNSGTTFDPGFLPDYALVIGTFEGNYFVDLFTLDGTAAGGGGSNLFIGDANDADVGANPANSSTTQGFEIRLTTSPDGAGADLALDRTSVLAFAAYTGESGFLSNQFISPAGGDNGNYGGNAVAFQDAPPDPVAYVWRQTAGGSGWRLRSWPVFGGTVGTLAAQNHVQGVIGAFPDAGANVLDYTGEFVPFLNVTQSLDVGDGFFWYHYAQSDFPGGQIPEGSGFQPLPFQLAAGGRETQGDAETSGVFGEFILGGNPFALAFDVAEMTVNIGGLGPLVYLYDPAGVEIAVDRNAPAEADRLVQPLRGFWIESTVPDPTRGAEAGGPIVTYLRSGRADGAPSPARTVAQRVLAFELDRVTPGGLVPADRSTRLAFVEGGTDGRDAFDATKPPTLAQAATRLAFLTDGDVRAQDSRAFDLDASVSAPLALRVDGDGAAEYVLRWPTLGNLPEGWTVRLLDGVTGTSTDLRTASQLTFTAGPTGGAWAERFSVVVSPLIVAGTPAPEATVRLSAPMPNPATGVARVALAVDRPQVVRAELLDALGRRVALVLDETVDGAREIRVPVSDLAPGVYVLRVTGDTFMEARTLTVAR